MTAINFPDSPSENEVFTSGTRSWKYVNGVWQTVTTSAGSQGDKGGLQYKFDESTIIGEPDEGFIRFDASTIADVSSIAFNANTIEGTDVSDYILEMSNSSSDVDGYIVIQSNTNNDPTYSIFAINGIVDYNLWLEVSVTYVSGVLPSAQSDLVIALNRTGDLGPTGPTGPGGTNNYRVTPTAPTMGSNDGQLVEGDTWFNSETGRFYIYYDGYWVENTSSLVGAGAGGAGGASVQVSDLEPDSPSEGDVWFNSNQGKSYIYYDNFWVDMNPGIQGPIGPQGITWTGNWASGPTASYSIGDAVALDGSSYLAVDAIAEGESFSNYPPTSAKWNILAQAGAEGPTGATGDTGPAGPTVGLVSQTDGTVTTASTSSGVVRNIFVSTSAPSGGIDGDIWHQYTA